MNLFRAESVYCLEYAKIYNANASFGSIGELSYYSQVALFLKADDINNKRA